MKRADKIKKRMTRAAFRRAKRNEWYINKICTANRNGFNIPLSNINRDGEVTNDCWSDPDSRTGYTQICSYTGTCEFPCNGDC